MGETRVVLVKPGDTLVFGNVGDVWGNDEGAAVTAALTTLKEATGVDRIVIFAADIDMAAVSADGA